MLQQLFSQVVNALPSVIIGSVIFLIFWFLTKFVVALINRIAEKKPPQKQPVFLVLSIFAKITLLLIGLITALGSAGVHVGALVASLGLSGFAISFAAKDAFSNLMAGILILLYQPFNIGDLIEIGDHKGQVIKMSLRYTHLRGENKEILIPNSNLLTNNLVILTPA